jgi:hypothetical protein
VLRLNGIRQISSSADWGCYLFFVRREPAEPLRRAERAQPWAGWKIVAQENLKTRRLMLAQIAEPQKMARQWNDRISVGVFRPKFR